MIAISADRMDWERSLEEWGYATLPGVLSSREIMVLLVAMADIVPHPTRAGVRHVLGHPAVKLIAHDQRLLGVAQKVLGSEAFPFRATLFDKSPDSNWLITWHQDTALPLQEKIETPGWGPWSVKEGVNYAHAPAGALSQVLALRLHLDGSTENNGPLRVLPGTHKMGVLSDDQVEFVASNRQGVDCLVAKGGVLVMRPLIIHASSKSQSQVPRRVLHIEYSAKEEMEHGLRLALA